MKYLPVKTENDKNYKNNNNDKNEIENDKVAFNSNY